MFVRTAQFRQNCGRIVSTENHDRGDFLLGLADQGGDCGAQSGGEQGKRKQGHQERRDQGAAVAQRFAEFLAVDDADIAEVHVSWSPARRREERRS